MKKGFTLIEIIITIGLLAIIGTVIVSNLSVTYTRQQEEQYENFKANLEKAACAYIDFNAYASLKSTCQANGSCTVTVQDLLEEGIIEDSDLTNPKTQSRIPGTTAIRITYTNGIKSCEYPE